LIIQAEEIDVLLELFRVALNNALAETKGRALHIA